MKTKILVHLNLILIVLFAFNSCKKDPKEPINSNSSSTTNSNTGKLILSFEAMFGDSVLVFHNKWYITSNGDSIKISTFKYYISNIQLTKTDNSIYIVPESYILVNHNAMGSLASFTLNNIPVGQYKGIKMLIGVDSARNVSGAQTGSLDPANGMFWSWTTGYIMLKLEGTSPQSGSTTKDFFYHIGGFSGVTSVLKWVNPSFNSATANVTSTTIPEIHFKTDISEIFKTPTTINLANDFNIVMPGVKSKMIADNYSDMITVEHIHN
ncbi:MAG: hypothetical protein KatS3mg027_0330 [Bacteroidia bacterium]|nr:MAG: hypothetical protein KatS3mg027_0330 [Bacteroidia bacterium]